MGCLMDAMHLIDIPSKMYCGLALFQKAFAVLQSGSRLLDIFRFARMFSAKGSTVLVRKTPIIDDESWLHVLCFRDTFG